MPNQTAPLELGERKSWCVCVWRGVGGIGGAWWVGVFFGQLFKEESCLRQSRLSGRRQADNGGASLCQGLHLKVTYTHTPIGTNKHTHTLSHHIPALTIPFLSFDSIYHFYIQLKAFPTCLFLSISITSCMAIFFSFLLFFSWFLPFTSVHPILSTHVISLFNSTYLELTADSLKYPEVDRR